MRAIKGVIVVVLILLAHSHANAQNAGDNEEIWVHGFGVFQCREWVDARAGRSQYSSETMRMWFEGYMTAYNRYGSATGFTGNGYTGIVGWLDNYCADNPLKILFEAAELLIIDLIRQATE